MLKVLPGCPHRSLKIISSVLAFILLPTAAGLVLGLDHMDHGSIDHQKDDIQGTIDRTGFLKKGSPMASSDLFIENRGQLRDRSVLFYSNANGGVVVRNDGFSIIGRDFPEGEIGVHFENVNPLSIKGEDQMETVFNYYRGSAPSGWFEGVRTFGTVVLNDAYPNIDIELRLKDGSPKYDIVARPGSDLSNVVLRYEGVDLVRSVGNDMIELSLSNGRSIIEGPLIALQNGEMIDCRYIVEGSSVRFHAPDMDPSEMLRIDPLLKASTYLGGNNWDRSAKITVHNSGDILVSGRVESTDMPTYVSSYERFCAGETDVYISRMSSDLTSLKFSTYLGGSLYELMGGVSFDSSGRIIISGSTNSTDLPTTGDAMMGTYKGGVRDAFMAVFSSTMGSLVYSTYFGGGGLDTSPDIDVDSLDRPVMIGYTTSTSLPVTSGALQTSLNGNSDIYVSRFSTSFTSVDMCTYLGGVEWSEEPFCLDIDDSDRPVIAGQTITNDFPVTPGAYCTSFGYFMGFVTSLEADGASLRFSTFFGNGTWIKSIDIGANGDHFMTGRTVTQAGGFPVSPNAFDKDFTGEEDAFVSKLSSDGSTLLYSSFLGADENFGGVPNLEYYEGGESIVSDGSGRAIVCGYTDSTYFPLTDDAFDRTRNEQDAFVSIISMDGSAIEYSTFLGGADEDRATGVVLNSSGTLFLFGDTYSNYQNHDFPTTNGAYDRTFSSGYDMFIASFKLDSYIPGPPTSLSSTSGDSFINLTWGPPVFDGNEAVTGYNIYRRTGASAFSFRGNVYDRRWYLEDDLTNGVRYEYEVKAVNKVGPGYGARVSDTPYSLPSAPTIFYTDFDDMSINISWFPSNDDGGDRGLKYRIYAGESSLLMEPVAENLSRTWFNLTGLINGRKYFMAVSAVNIVGEGPLSKTTSAIPFSVPTAPRNLRAYPSDRAVNLAWDPPSDLGGAPNVTYTVFMGSNLTDLVTYSIGINQTMKLVFGLTNGRIYGFAIAAENPRGMGPVSAMAFAYPLGPLSPPLNLSGTEGGDHVNLSWLPPESTGGCSNLTYNVYMGGSELDLGKVSNVGSTRTTIWNLSQGESYFFAVSAWNGRFEGPLSDTIDLRPLNRPSAPRNLAFSIRDGGINLSWSSPEDDGGDPDLLYDVHMGLGMDNMYSRTVTPNLTLMVTGLINGNAYHFAVNAINSKGAGPFSEIVTAVPMSPPSPPSDLSYREGDGSLNISWGVPNYLGGAPWVAYNIYLGEKEGSLSAFASNITSYHVIITGLENGKEYRIGASAFNQMGESEISEMIAVAMTYPGPPVNFKVEIVSGMVSLSWGPPENDGGGHIWYYHIYRGTSTLDLERLGSVDSSHTSYTDDEAEKGTTYFYAVRAENGHGMGSMTDHVSIKLELEREKGKMDLTLWIIAAVVLLLIVIAVSISILLWSNRSVPFIEEE